MGTRFSKPSQTPNPYALECSEPPRITTPNPVETPRRRPFPPPSPAKHLTAAILRRLASAKHRGGAIQEEEAVELDKNFRLSKKFASRFEIGEEVGRGHFGYTCSAIAKKGEIKGRKVAVKVIPKSKMTTDIAIEDVRREIKILSALTGHQNVIQFYDAFEDSDSVYIVMELCEGGELLDRILTRGVFVEDYAKTIIVQILNAVAFFHLQGVVHRDIKPENFLFASEDENSQLKAIDFGISDFVQPDQKLKDIVGSAYYVAPEVLKRSYSTEADVWSVGVIAYILLCGTRPFWDRTEAGIFQAVLKANPSFNESPWPSLSSESKDFVRCLLRKDPKRRLTAAQALCHPWLRNHKKVILPLDIQIFRPMKAYMRSSALRRAALRALSKTLTMDELFYLKEQFALMFPDSSGGITLDSIKKGLARNATDAARESQILHYLNPLNALGYRKMYFEEFRAAALNIHQLETVENWEQRLLSAYEIFDKDGNRAIVIQELTTELGISPSVPIHVVLQEYIRNSDGKLTFPSFVKLLHGQPTCSSAKTP